MANKFVTAIFGDYSKHEVKKLQKTVTKINDLADKYKAMDDKELAGQTPILKDRLSGCPDGNTCGYTQVLASFGASAPLPDGSAR